MQSTLETLLASCCGGPEDATHCSIMEALDANAIDFQSGRDKLAANEV